MKSKVFILITLPLLLLGAEWQSLNGPPAGRADDMSMGEYEGLWVIYAADKTHKLYKSENEGELWEVPTDDERVDNPTCVITDENNAQIVYIGKNDVTPVWWSEDGGQTWEERSGEYPNNITNTNPRCFAMHPNYSNKIYLGCQFGACAVFKTVDGGETWDEKDILLTNDPTVNDIAITHDPLRGTWIIAGCSGTSDRGIWLSTDGGDNWHQKLSDVDIYSVDFATQFTGYVGSEEGVYKTTNGGVDWSLLDGSPTYVKTIVTINPNTVYVGVASGVMWTTDGGVNWDECNGAGEDKIFSKDIQKMLVHPDDQNQIFTGANLAIYKTTDGGEHWSEITKGFKVSDFESNTFDYVDKKADYNDVSIFSQQTHKNLK